MGAALKFAMAELSDFKGITIYMHSEPNSKHESPHFHAKHEYDCFDASYGIPLLNKMAGGFPKDKEKSVLKWAQRRLDDLHQNWDLLINGKPPKKIEPIQKRSHYRGIAIYNPYHKIIGFRIADDYVLEIFFNDGFSRVIDFYPFLRGSWYGQLRDLELFNQVHIRHGGNLYWPNDVEWSSKDLYCWDDVKENYHEWMKHWE